MVHIIWTTLYGPYDIIKNVGSFKKASKNIDPTNFVTINKKTAG